MTKAMTNNNTRLVRKSLSIAVHLVLLGAAIPVHATPTFVLADLGSLGGGSSSGYAINDAGQVAGQSLLANDESHAFLWQNGTMQDLGTLGGDTSIALALSNSGQVVGQASIVSGVAQAFSWQNGLMTDIGSAPGTTASSLANGVNADGQIVGTRIDSASSQALLWENGAGASPTSLPDGSLTSQAAGINRAGEVVGTITTDFNTTQAVLWRPDGDDITLIPLAGLDANADSVGLAINGQGQAVGAAATLPSTAPTHAVLWQSDGSIQDLGTLGGGNSQANAINANGQVVGQSGAAGLPSTDSHGFLWHSGGMADLNSLASANPAALTITAAKGINALGQITGTALDSSGQPRGFIATPTGSLGWIGGSSGEWDKSANWELGFTPNHLLDTAIAPSTGEVDVTGPQHGATVNSLSVGGGGGDRATLSLDGDAPLSAHNGISVLNRGTVVLEKDNAIDAATAVRVDGGALDMSDFNNTVAAAQLKSGQIAGDGTLTSTSDFDLQSGTVNANLGGAVGLLKTTAGTVNLYGVNTYTGATKIVEGTLTLNDNGSISASSGVRNDGHFDISGAGDIVSIHALTGNGAVNLGGQSLKLTAASGEFGGVIAGNGGLTVVGGSQTLSGANTFSGLTEVASGAALALKGAGALASFDGVRADGTLDVSAANNASVARLSGAGHVALGANTLTVSAGNSDFAFTGVIQGTGGLTVAGGWQVLSGVNSYSGQTRIGSSGAVLFLSGAGSIAASAGVDNQGGDLKLYDVAGDSSLKTLTGTGGVWLDSHRLNLTAAAGEFGGDINGQGGGLTVQGGVQTLTGANGYSGQTRIDAGAGLILKGAGGIANSSGINLGGSLDIAQSDAGASVGGLSGQGVVTLGGKTLSVHAPAAPGTDFGGVIQGTGGLSVAAGVQTLSAANTYTGATAVEWGATLALSGVGGVAQSSGAAIDGTLDLSAAAAPSLNALTGNGDVVLGGNTLTLNAATGDFHGVIQGAGGVSVAGGAQSLSGANAYTGMTAVRAGATLRVVDGGDIGASAGLQNAGVFDIAGSWRNVAVKTLSGNGAVNLGGQTLKLTAASGDIGGVIQGTGSLSVEGGTATLSAANTYTGPTQIAAGATLALKGAGSLAASGGVQADGSLDLTQTNGDTRLAQLTGGGIVQLGGHNLSLTAASGEFSGGIQGSGGLDIQGGWQTLGGVNSYSGQTRIASGATLALSGAGSLAASAGVDNQGGDLRLDSAAGDSTLKTLTGTGAAWLGGNRLVLSAAAGEYGGDIQGQGGLTVQGGVQTLTGAISYSGQTQIGSGATLALKGAGGIGNSVGVQTDGTLDIAQTSTGTGVSVGGLSGHGVVALGGQTLSVYAPAAGADFGGDIQGAGGLTVGAGVQTLSGANSYTGATTVQSGAQLKLAGAGSVEASSGAAIDGTLDLSAANAARLKTLTGSGSVKLGGGALALTAAAGDFGGIAEGSGGLSVEGGTQRLSGVNAYTGMTAVRAGATLRIADGGGIGASAGVQNAGVFDIAETWGSDAAVKTLTGNGVVQLGDHTLKLTAAAGDFGGVIQDSGGLSVEGGIQTLSGVNTYAGTTRVSAGTLIVDGGGAIADTGWVDLAGGGNLELAASETIGALSGVAGSQVKLNANRLTVGRLSGQTPTGDFAGIVSGTGGLVKHGTDTLTLSGANTYTGPTQVNAGALALQGGAAIADSGAVEIRANGRLELLDSETIGALSGTASSQIWLDSNTLTAGDASNSLFAGVISGTGGLTKRGSGLLTLAGANSYLGPTNILEGALSLQASDAISDSSRVNIGAAGRLDLGSDNTLGALTSVAGSQISLNGHTLTTADTTLSGGQLQGTGTLSIIPGSYSPGTYTIGGSSNLTVNGSVSLDSGITVSNAGNTLVNSSGRLDGSGQYVQTAGETRVEGVLATAFTRLQGGVLRGAGTVGGDLVNAATVQGDTGGITLAGNVSGAGNYTGDVNFTGTFSPGNSPALVQAENISFGPNSQLLMELGGLTRGSEYDAINAKTVKLGGALDVRLINGFMPTAGNQFDLIQAQSITGTFDAPFACPAAYVGSCRLTNDGTLLSLLFLQSNPSATGSIEDALPEEARNSLTLAQYPSALEQIKPKQQTALATLSTFAADMQVNNITQHLNNWRTLLNNPNLGMQTVSLNLNGVNLPSKLWPAMASGGGAGDDADGGWASRLGGFANARFEFDDRRTTALQRGYHANTYAFTAGVDYRINPRFLVGLAGIYNYTDNTLSTQGGTQSIYGYGATGFASLYLTDHWYVDFIANGTYNEYNSKRNIAFGTVNTSAQGRTDGLQSHYSVNTGYDFPIKEWTLGARARTEYVNTPIRGFRESGAALNLNLAYPDRTLESLTSTLGGMVSHTASTPVGVFVSQLVLEWEHQHMDNAPLNGVSFASNPNQIFNAALDNTSPDYFNIRSSVSAQLANGASAFIQYDTTLGMDNLSRHALNIGVRMEF